MLQISSYFPEVYEYRDIEVNVVIDLPNTAFVKPLQFLNAS